MKAQPIFMSSPNQSVFPTSGPGWILERINPSLFVGHLDMPYSLRFRGLWLTPPIWSQVEIKVSLDNHGCNFLSKVDPQTWPCLNFPTVSLSPFRHLVLVCIRERERAVHQTLSWKLRKIFFNIRLRYHWVHLTDYYYYYYYTMFNGELILLVILARFWFCTLFELNWYMLFNA
jgi:hypothetical protein